MGELDCMQSSSHEASDNSVVQIMGCRLGLRQPNVNLRIKIPRNILDPFESIDEWLRRSFRIPFVDGYQTGQFPETKSQAEAVTFRVMELANAVLRMAGIPCFEPGRILSINSASPSPDFFDVEIVTPIIEKLPLNAVATAYQLALAIILEVSKNGSANLDMEKVSDALDSEMIQPWTRNMRSSTAVLALLQAAHHHGVPIIHLGNSYYQAGWGSRRTIFHNSSTLLDSAIGSRLTDDKAIANQILQMAGFPVPRQILAPDVSAAKTAAKALGYPAVLKPTDRNRGEGVFIDLMSDQDVAQAFKKAKKFSNSIALEEQVPGICHRIFVAYGQVRYVVVRHPLHVVGDGKRTIEELIDQANAEQAVLPRFWRAKPLPKDALARDTLQGQGYTLATVLPTGAKANLRPIESTEWGGIIEDVTASTHPDNLTLAIKAAEQFGLNICGVDLMTTDASVPWYENGAKLNELNYLPAVGYLRDYTDKMTKSLIASIFPEQGRIPLRLLVGGKAAIDAAMMHQAAMLKDGSRCHLVSHDCHLGADGRPIVDAIHNHSLFRRVRAVLMDPQADALIIVAQNDEFLLSGLPVDRLDKFEIVDEAIGVINRPNAPSAAMAVKMLEGLVQRHLV